MARLKARFAVPVLVIVLVAAAIGIFIKVMSSPAEGTIIATPAGNIAVTANTKPEPGIYKGKYISFSLSADYKRAPNQSGSGYLDNALFVTTDHTGKQLAVSVIKQNPANDPSVSFRRQHQDVYHEQALPGGLLFTKTKDGSERTAYITHGELELTIAFSSPHDNQDFTSDMDGIINSLKWLK